MSDPTRLHYITVRQWALRLFPRQNDAAPIDRDAMFDASDVDVAFSSVGVVTLTMTSAFSDVDGNFFLTTSKNGLDRFLTPTNWASG